MGATGLGPWWGYFQRLKMLNPLDTIKCTTVYSVKVCVCVGVQVYSSGWTWRTVLNQQDQHTIPDFLHDVFPGKQQRTGSININIVMWFNIRIPSSTGEIGAPPRCQVVSSVLSDLLSCCPETLANTPRGCCLLSFYQSLWDIRPLLQWQNITTTHKDYFLLIQIRSKARLSEQCLFSFWCYLIPGLLIKQAQGYLMAKHLRSSLADVQLPWLAAANEWSHLAS